MKGSVNIINQLTRKVVFGAIVVRGWEIFIYFIMRYMQGFVQLNIQNSLLFLLISMEHDEI